jgi:hypothetical protein
MFAEEEGPAETATGLADEFVDAAVAKLDALFGAGYAKGNPQALAAYIAACASNLQAFMTAAAAIDDDSLDEALAAFGADYPAKPNSKPKGKRR